MNHICIQHDRSVAEARNVGRAARVVYALLLGALVGACNDAVVASNGVTAVNATTARAVGDPDADSWNAFDMDVAVSFPVQFSGDSDTHAGGLAFHVHKRRDADGQWVSDVLLPDDSPIVNVATERDPNAVPHIARVTGISRTTMPHFLTAAGAEVPSRTLSFPSAAGGADFRPRRRALPPELQIPERARGQRLHADTTREWIDHFIVTAKGAQRMRKRLQEGGGKAAAMAGGKSRFVSRRGDADVEVIVDDRSGRVTQTRLVRRGQLQAMTELDYTEVQPGTWVLRSERISQFQSEAHQPPRTMLVTYSNIRLTEDR